MGICASVGKGDKGEVSRQSHYSATQAIRKNVDSHEID